MFERIASTEIVDSEIERNFASTQVFEAIKAHLMKITDNNESRVDLLLKSPACFGVASSFALSEYIKNTGDAGGTKIDVYARLNDDSSISFLVKDDGPGFPDAFLKKNSGETMVSYFNKKLKSEDGKEKSRIESSKTSESKSDTDMDAAKIKGGQGLGLATVARVLEKTGGSFLVGNFADLPQSIQANINEIDNVTESKHDKGHAIHMMTSNPYSPEMADLFSDRASITTRYTTYVESIDNDPDKLAAKFAAANFDNEDNEETISFSLSLPFNRFGAKSSQTEDIIESESEISIITDEMKAVDQFRQAEQAQAPLDPSMNRSVTALPIASDASANTLDNRLGVDTPAISADTSQGPPSIKMK